MAASVHPRLSPGEGRRFSFTIAVGFGACAVLMWWSGRSTLAGILAIIGGLLSGAGLVVPTRLGPLERAWMTLGHAISLVTTPIVLAVMYFLIITPVGVLRRAMAHNPIVHRPAEYGYWKRRAKGRSASMERQF